MAIAEAEPKKSEVAVTSAGDRIKTKALNAGKNFPKNKECASSSTSTSVGTVKRYNLYDTIKGFRWEMPGGWNDEDIALFVTCCWEKKDDFNKPNIDKTEIWDDIAQSGAKKSRNPSLFTINSCLELAERIRYYVSKNMSIFLDNEPFMKFHSDVKSLLPHFSDNYVTKKVTENKGNRKKVKNKTMNESSSDLLNNDSDLGGVIHDMTLEYASAIRSGNPDVWTDMSNKLKERLGVNLDVKNILESEKIKIITDVSKQEEKGVNKEDAFIERARGFIEVFDFITPKKVKVKDFVISPSVDSTVDALITNKDNTMVKGTELGHNLEPDVSLNKNVDGCDIESGNKEEETTRVKKVIKRGRPSKYKKRKIKVAEFKDEKEDTETKEGSFSVEPSSTISFDEPQNLNEQEINITEEKDKKHIPDESAEKINIWNPIKRSPHKSPGRWSKERTPERVMPARSARNKVTSYSLVSKTRIYKNILSRNNNNNSIITETTNKTPQTIQSSHNNQINDKENAKKKFVGLDSESEDITEDYTDKFKRMKNSPTKTRVANPDTTTNDPDDKSVSRNSSSNYTPYVKRVNRKRKDTGCKKEDLSSQQESSRTKVRIVHADSTMKNLVVKLVDCQHTVSSMGYPSHRSFITLTKRQEKTTSPFLSSIRSEGANEVRLIEETVVLAKDVLDREYNPSSDSAKLVSDEHLNKGQCSGLIKGTKRVSESMMIPLSSSSQYSSVVESSMHLTKHHINPFCESSKHTSSKGSTSASADSPSCSSEDKSARNRVDLAAICTELQESSIRPYSASADTSNQPSTSSGLMETAIMKKSSLESALATLKKSRKEFLASHDNALCVSTTNIIPNRFLAEIEDAKLPEWFGDFVTGFREHEVWKIQQLLKMQQELADVEYRKVQLLEKILGSLMKH